MRLLRFKIRSYQELGKVRKMLILRYLSLDLLHKFCRINGCGGAGGPFHQIFSNGKRNQSKLYIILRASIRNSELA